jgi:DNA-binding HxlR family transcriptional regulator
VTTSDALPRACTIASALHVLGEKWSLLVVRELALGVHRFDQIQRNTGAPRDILASRLRRLEETGVVAKRQYQERPCGSSTS